MSKTTKTIGCDIPNWVYQAIYAKLDNPSALRKQDITMITNYEPYLENMQVLAYASPSKYDGALVIFEEVNGCCQEVYSLKTNMIGPVEANYSDIILTVWEEGSTGFATFNYVIIKHTPTGYQQVWQGLSNRYDYYGPVKLDITAGVNINHNAELVHSVLERRYRGDNPNKTVFCRKYTDVYRYNERAMQYQFVRRY